MRAFARSRAADDGDRQLHGDRRRLARAGAHRGHPERRHPAPERRRAALHRRLAAPRACWGGSCPGRASTSRSRPCPACSRPSPTAASLIGGDTGHGDPEYMQPPDRDGRPPGRGRRGHLRRLRGGPLRVLRVGAHRPAHLDLARALRPGGGGGPVGGPPGDRHHRRRPRRDPRRRRRRRAGGAGPRRGAGHGDRGRGAPTRRAWSCSGATPRCAPATTASTARPSAPSSSCTPRCGRTGAYEHAHLTNGAVSRGHPARGPAPATRGRPARLGRRPARAQPRACARAGCASAASCC